MSKCMPETIYCCWVRYLPWHTKEYVCTEAPFPNDQEYIRTDIYDAVKKERDDVVQFAGLYTSFDTTNKEMNAARYDGYLDGVQVGMDHADHEALEVMDKMANALESILYVTATIGYGVEVCQEDDFTYVREALQAYKQFKENKDGL